MQAPRWTEDEAATAPQRADESGEHRKHDLVARGDEDSTLDRVVANRRYDFAELLGEGGMGEVRLCVDRRVQRPIAMKMLRAERAHRPEERVRFVREAMAQANLEHPAIVPVYDLGTDEGGALYFTMRRVQGFTLDEILRGLHRGDASFTETYTRHRLLSSFGSVCQAVHYAHTRSVFHCDIKPGNVMLGSFGEVYVLDWGIADTDASSSIGGGTLGYMAPEQMRLEPVDARTDVYALGITLFEILTRTPMFRGELEIIYKRQLSGERPRPSERAPELDIAPELDAICMKATELEPDDRYQSVGELHAALERYLAGDRDLALRREMSRAHVEAASAAASRVRAGGAQAFGARSEALRSVGRALAFDPENEAALRSLLELLSATPEEMPPEARAEMNAAERSFQRTRAVAGAAGFFVWVALMPLFYFAGTPHVGALVLNAVVWALAGCMLLRVAHRPSADGRSGIAMPVVGALAISLATGVLGSVALTAAFASVFTMGFTLAMHHRHRFVPLVAGALAVVAPSAFVAAGALPSWFHAGDPLLLIANLACVGVAGTFSLKLREKLTQVQERAYVNAWQLRQLLPREAVSVPPSAVD